MPVAEEVPIDFLTQHTLEFDGGSIACKKDYFELKLIEFVELIGRIAELMRIKSHKQATISPHLKDDNYPLIKYIELILDIVIRKLL